VHVILRIIFFTQEKYRTCFRVNVIFDLWRYTGNTCIGDMYSIRTRGRCNSIRHSSSSWHRHVCIPRIRCYIFNHPSAREGEIAAARSISTSATSRGAKKKNVKKTNEISENGRSGEYFANGTASKIFRILRGIEISDARSRIDRETRSAFHSDPGPHTRTCARVCVFV